MSYPITERLLPTTDSDRPKIPLKPQGLTIHETATPNATADQEVTYFATHTARASAHIIVDYSTIIRMIPENEMAYHAGPTANSKYLSLEMCHFDDPTKFAETWKRAVWYAADACHRYNWNPKNIEQLNTHEWVSQHFHETDHTDPVGYFQKHGKTWDDFVNDVVKEMQALTPPKKTSAKATTSSKAAKYNLPDIVIRLMDYHHGPETKQVQKAINVLWKTIGLSGPLAVDGCYGPLTSGAVKRFQQHHKITADGIYGPQTKAKLLEVLP